jgi:hypothetical protein
MLSYEQVQNKPRALQSLSGLNVNEFEQLLVSFEQAWQDYIEQHYNKPGRQRRYGGGRTPQLKRSCDKLLFILVYYRLYPTQEVQGFVFGIGQPQTHEWVHKLSRVLNQALGYEKQLPEREAHRLEEVLSECPSLEFIIDGTERRMNRPKDKARQQYYSGKKKGFTLKNNWIGAIVAIAIGAISVFLPAHAQSDQQVRALVEALRQAAPQTGDPNDGLYSDWQIQAPNIPRWSQACIGRTLSPQQFEADIETARTVLVCVMRDVLQEEYRNSGNDEAIAVRRAAAWWMTGDSARYDAAETAAYTQQVLNFYQQQLGTSSATVQPNSTSSSEDSAPAQNTPYDRYMRAGYAAVEQQDYEVALLHFRRALDERPNDTYAQRAIQNVERYRDQSEGRQ